jgi:hypothetical protein
MTEPTSRGADPDLPATASSTVSPASASKWEDFIDIFYAPAAVFARRMTSGFFVPMLVVTVLAGTLYLVNGAVWSQVMEAEMVRAQAKSPQTLTPEQMQAARSFVLIVGKIGAFVLTPIAIFLTGLALWVCGKFFEAKQSLGQAVMVASYAYVPRIVEGVVTSVQGLLLDPSTFTGRWRVSLGVGRFLDPDATSPALLALVGRIDVFTIWVTVLLAIGLAVTGRISRVRAAIAAAIVWFVGALPLLLQAR